MEQLPQTESDDSTKNNLYGQYVSFNPLCDFDSLMITSIIT